MASIIKNAELSAFEPLSITSGGTRITFSSARFFPTHTDYGIDAETADLLLQLAAKLKICTVEDFNKVFGELFE